MKKLVLTAVILGFSVACYAAVPWTKFSYWQNWGGLNDNLSSTEIQDNEASDIQNIVFDTGGAIKKRYGYENIPDPIQQVISGCSAITGLTFFEKSSDGSRYLVGICNAGGVAKAFDKIYTAGGGPSSGAWVDISGVGILSSNYANTYLATLSTANDNVIITMANPSAPMTPFKWTGTGNVSALTADADCPPATINAYHKNILFTAGDPAHPSRVSFSDLTGGITNWIATDFFEVSTNDSTQIKAIVSAFDFLYIIKDRSIWRLSGSDRDSFVLEKMIDGVGTQSQHGVAVLGSVIYFVTDQGDIAMYDGNYGIQFVSTKVRNTLTNFNKNQLPQAIGLAFSSYRFNDYDFYTAQANQGSSTNNVVLFYDSFHKAWSKFVGMYPCSWTIADNSNGTHMMVFGDYNGYVYSYPSTEYYDGDVTSGAIDAFYQTKWFRYNDVSLGDKYLKLFKTYALSETTTNTNLTLTIKQDYATTGTDYTISLTQTGALWDVAKWDVDTWAGQGLVTDREETNNGTNMFQFKWENKEANHGFTVLGFDSFIEPASRI